MKIILFVLVIVLEFPAPAARAAFYRWFDSQGVTHFTDDPDKIPRRYQKRARRLNLSDEPASARVSAPEPQAAAQVAKPQVQGLEAHTEQWWRTRFSTLRGELKLLQNDLPAKQATLAELRRKRVIYQRAQDREEVNKIQTEVFADEARMTDLQNQIDELDRDAARAFVPVEWRQ